MNPWSAAVEALASALLAVGDLVGGGRALGIALVTFAVRSALIPLLAPLAVRTRDRQRVVRRIRPEIRALDRELRDQPALLTKRLEALHAENGIGMVDWPGLGAAFIQLPILIALFQAVLIVWEPDALTWGGLGLGLLAAGLSLFGTKASGQAEGAPWLLWVSGILPVVICLWLGTGIGLYLTGFYAAGAVQALLMRRSGAAAAPAPAE